MPLLVFRDLEVHYRTYAGMLRAVDGISLDLDRGEILGLVGESGCGKSTVAKSIMRLLPSDSIIKGTISFNGDNLVEKNEHEMTRIRGKEISLITQSAMNALDPVQRVGNQIVEAIRTHRKCSRGEARKEACELLELVGLEKRRFKNYAHELSGGQRQRVIIAMALVSSPKLVIADEPTTGLDVIMEFRILEHLRKLQSDLKLSILLISHDISITAQLAHKIAIMYAGKIMEYGPVSEVLKQKAYHPYTLGLLNAFPDIKNPRNELISIPGSPCDLVCEIKGCRFHERCPFSTEECFIKEPEWLNIKEGHYVRCHYPDKMEIFQKLSRERSTWIKDGDSD